MMCKCKTILFFLSFILITTPFSLFAGELRKNQSKDAALLLSAKIISQPPSIEINWVKHPLAYLYQIRRKNFGDLYFPVVPLAQLDSTTTSYLDSQVELGKEYEYEVRAYYKALADVTIRRNDGTYFDTTLALHFIAFGFLHSGIEVPPRHYLGKVLLLVDETIAVQIGDLLDEYEIELLSEGWEPIRYNVPRADTFDASKVQIVKNIILDEYAKDPQNLNSIVLIGRVPVPYSGDIYPDGHPDHRGAWPCDMYYGSIYESFWTDFQVNSTSAKDPRNRNIPGDGKFDQSTPSGSVIDFAVGRIDFFNLPKFNSKTEIDLLRQYLRKNLDFRTGKIQAKPRGLIDDNFGANRYLNAFASSGYRNFASLLGPENVFSADWFTTLSTDWYLWAYGCGGGTYLSAGGVGSTDDFVTKQAKSVFTMLFGSYFGDWDSQNNFMRSALASEPSILTCSWAGFPHWYFHNMSANLPIGFSTKITQNNYSSYIGAAYSLDSTNYSIVAQGLYQTHVSLLGDPTLSMYSSFVEPPTSLSVYQPEGDFVHLQWQAPSSEVDGYYIYKSTKPLGKFELINNDPLLATEFIDTSLYEGKVYYMVRSVKKLQNNSGSFAILSRGVIQNALITTAESQSVFNIVVAPNPAKEKISFSITLTSSVGFRIEIYDSFDNQIKSYGNLTLSDGTHIFEWDLTASNGKQIPPGVYFVKILLGNKAFVQKFVKI
ncbi:MAG: T9SS type A sorting domain-containing protein [Candidatus Kapaibacteriales bacterium]